MSRQTSVSVLTNHDRSSQGAAISKASGVGRRDLGGPAGGGVVTYSARGKQNVAVVSGIVGVYNLVAREIGGGNTTVTVFRLVR
jgi:hypothetical protein